MVLFESRRKLQYFTFDESNDQISKSRQDVQKKGRETCTLVNNIWLGHSWQTDPLLSGFLPEKSIRRSISYGMQEFRI